MRAAIVAGHLRDKADGGVCGVYAAAATVTMGAGAPLPPPFGPPGFVASGEGFFRFSPLAREAGEGPGERGFLVASGPLSVAPAKAGDQSCVSSCRLRRSFSLALRAQLASGGELFARTKSSTKMLPPGALAGGLGIAATPPTHFPYREPITRWVCFPAPSKRRNVCNLSDAVRTGLRPVLFFLPCPHATWAAQAHPAVRLPKCSREQ